YGAYGVPSPIGGRSRWGRSRAGYARRRKPRKIAQSERKVSGSGRRFPASTSIIPARRSCRPIDPRDRTIIGDADRRGRAAALNPLDQRVQDFPLGAVVAVQVGKTPFEE